MKGHSLARFLSDDLSIVRELRSDEVEKAIETVDSSVSGLVVDLPVDEKLLDRLVWKGLSYVAAKDFKGIIKRPLSHLVDENRVIIPHSKFISLKAINLFSGVVECAQRGTDQPSPDAA